MIDGYIIGIDIGGTNIRIGSVLGESELKYFHKASSHEILQESKKVDNLIGFIQTYINIFLKDAPVKAIALGLPSILDKRREYIYQTPNIDGFDNIFFKKELEKVFGMKIYIERDVNLLFYNDKKVFGFLEKGISVGIYIGTGIGNAIFIDGKPLLGKNGAAGELGHIPIGFDGKLCGCGNKGCAESYAAGQHLTEIVKEYFGGEDISDVFTKHSEFPKIQEFIDYIARVIAIEINILDPEAVVIGGGVIGMKNFPIQNLEERIHYYTRKPFPEQNLELFYSLESCEKGVKGAIEYAKAQMRI